LLLFKKEKEYSKHLRERKHTNQSEKDWEGRKQKSFILKVKKTKPNPKSINSFQCFSLRLPPSCWHCCAVPVKTTAELAACPSPAAGALPTRTGRSETFYSYFVGIS